ncbi:MAG: sugar phosphate isomerase/epimerase family protein [Acutalibacteraceae bacterium]
MSLKGLSCYQTSISTTFNYAIPVNEQLVLVKNAGFTHVSLGMNYEHSQILNEESLNSLVKLLNELDLMVDTVHGYDLDKEDAIEVNKIVAEAANKLKAGIVVVHCSDFWFNDTEYETKEKIVRERICSLEEIAKENGIRFALENVVPGKPTMLCEQMIEIGNPRYIGFCYDSSHDQIDGPNNMELLKRQKERLIAIHISDRIKEFVDHVIPGEGFIHFDEIIPLLRESTFKGPVLMEVEMTHSKYKDVNEFLIMANNSAQNIAKEICR